MYSPRPEAGPPRLLLAPLPLLLAGCLQERPVLSQLADARGRAVVEAATAPARLAVASGALVAEYCSLELADWEAAGEEGPDFPAWLAAYWGEPGSRHLDRDGATGVYTYRLEGVSPPDLPLRSLELDVSTPQEAFELRYYGESHQVPLLSVGLATSGCGGDDHRVEGLFNSVAVGDTGAEGLGEWSLDLGPVDSEVQGLHYAGGQLLPVSGAFSWSGETRVGRAVLVSDDASALGGNCRWAATVGGADWGSSVVLDFCFD